MGWGAAWVAAPIFGCVLTVASLSAAASERAATLSLAKVVETPWQELQPAEGTLLGSSFRILVNEEALRWLRRERATPEGAYFVKLNRNAVGDLDTDPDWQRARFEVMRPVAARDGTRNWEFFTFGTLGKISESAGILPEASCLTCHRRRAWRGEPLFVDFYTRGPIRTRPSALTLSETPTATRLVVRGR